MPTKKNTEILTLGDLEGMSRERLIEHLRSEYEATAQQLDGVEFLVAYESVGDYGCDSASHFVIRRAGVLMIVEGSHCSCHGFEGQWDPAPVTARYLLSDLWSPSTGSYDSEAAENVASMREHVRKIVHRDG